MFKLTDKIKSRNAAYFNIRIYGNHKCLCSQFVKDNQTDIQQSYFLKKDQIWL